MKIDLKKIIITVILIFSVSALFASSFSIGVEADYNYTFVNTKTRFDGYNYGGFHGFDVTVPVEYRILSWLSVDSGIRYIMKSETFLNVNTSTDEVIHDYLMMHHFLELPLTVRFSMNIDRVRIFVGGGGYVGWRLGEVHSGKAYNVDSTDLKSFTSIMPLGATDNRFDAGLIAEGGVAYGFDLGELYLSVRYQYGLTSLATKQRDAVNTYLDNISAGIGFLFRV